MAFQKIKLTDYPFLLDIEGQYSTEFIVSNNAIIIEKFTDSVTIAITDTSYSILTTYLEKYHYPLVVTFKYVPKPDFTSFISNLLDGSTVSVNAKQGNQENFSIDSLEQNAPVVNLINAMFIEAIRCNASDIHIEMTKDDTRIRYRIDGMLKTVKSLPKDIFAAFSSRIKIMGNLNIMEKRLPQDGRMSVSIGGLPVDIRISIVPTTEGESIALRIFNTSLETMQLEQLGFSVESIETFDRIIKYPYGLILVSGPTGSGKTTTLHALLKRLSAENLKIVTIEDPVEQILPNVTQIPINDKIDISFDSMLRRVLRHDPDVIMVGEIRDNATAELAIRAALTGHLILSTIHTNDSASVITRLRNMNIEPFLITSVLRCVIAQRLVRRICPHCAEKIDIVLSPEIKKKYSISDFTAKKGKGCNYCFNTGYKDRIAVAEYYCMSDGLEKLILEGATTSEIFAYTISKGMVSLFEDGLCKVSQGITSLEELEREVLT